MLIAQISDLHIRRPGQLAYRRIDTAPYLARCVARLNHWAPRIDAVIITGDLVDAGHPDEYAHLRQLLDKLELPYYLMVGNHDRRAALRAAFGDHPYLLQGGEFIQYRVELGTAGTPLQLIALDTLDESLSGGRLCQQRLAWLEQQLAAADGAPLLLAMHHPPFVTGIGHMDSALLDAADSAALAALIARYPNVERLVCGHLHRPIHARFAGTIASTAPSPAHQVVLDLHQQAPSAFVMEPPAFALHQWHDGVGLVSHHGYLEHFEGPYPFHENDGTLID